MLRTIFLILALLAPVGAGAAPPPDTEGQAQALMTEGRGAIARENNDTAIRAFLRLLALPANSYTKDAREFLGLAYERAGKTAQARAEYQRYLGLYPNGDDAARVRQRLANLTSAPVAPLQAAPKAEPNRTNVYGSVSQYYYHGNSHLETTTTTGTTVDKATLDSTDQSSLITSVDLNARYRTDSYDNRAVIRDTYSASFLDNADNNNRLSDAYFEHKNRKYEYSVRLGRQPGNSGGVLGRFDGLLAGYYIAPKWRVNAVSGVPVDYSDISADREFYGLSLEMGTFAEHWNGSVYGISQQVDGIVDRQAVGGDLRYFDPKRSLYTLVDYDTSYQTLNILMLQGTYQDSRRRTWNFLADRRYAPVLQTSNALIGETSTSITAQLTTRSEDEIRALAEARTPLAKTYMVGVTYPFTKRWQHGVDVTMYRISGLPVTQTQSGLVLQATPNTGNVWVGTARAIGTGVLFTRDTVVASYSYLTSDSYNGHSLSFTERAILYTRWTLDGSLRLYQQEDNNTGALLTRTTPTLRLAYRKGDRLTLEAEIGVEKSVTELGPTRDDNTRQFYMVGYRWDF